MSYGKKASHVEPVSTQNAFNSPFNIGFSTSAEVKDGGPSALCSVDSSSSCSRESWHADAGHDDEPGRLIGSASSALHAPQVALDQDHLSEGGEEEECEHDEVLSDEADETVAQVNPPVSKAPLPHLAVSKANLFAKPQAPKTPMAKAIMQKAPMPLAALMKAAAVKAAPLKADLAMHRCKQRQRLLHHRLQCRWGRPPHLQWWWRLQLCTHRHRCAANA